MAFGVTPSFAHIARPAGRDVFGRQILAAPSIGTMLALSIVRKMSKLISSVRATCHAAPAAGGAGLGDSHAAIDISSSIALLLLGLTVVEMTLRLRARTRAVAET